MKIIEINEEIIEIFSPFNNFAIEFDELGKIKSYIVYYKSESFLLAVDCIVKKSGNEEMNKFRIRSIFDVNGKDDGGKVEFEVVSFIIKRYFSFLKKELEEIEEKIEKIAKKASCSFRK